MMIRTLLICVLPGLVVAQSPTLPPGLPPGTTFPPILDNFPDRVFCDICGGGMKVENTTAILSFGEGLSFSCGEAEMAGEFGVLPSLACNEAFTLTVVKPVCGCMAVETISPKPTPTPVSESPVGAPVAVVVPPTPAPLPTIPPALIPTPPPKTEAPVVSGAFTQNVVAAAAAVAVVVPALFL